MGRRIGTLGLVNYKDHPADNRYKVFNFNTKTEADYFEQMLIEKGVWFEKDEEEVEDKAVINLVPSEGKMMTMYLFAVNQKDFDKAQKANYLVSAKYRKPTINNKYLRIGLLVFFFFVLTLGIISYFKTQV
jgi:hypothetical protein